MGETSPVAGKPAPPAPRYLPNTTLALVMLRDALTGDRNTRDIAVMRLTAMQRHRPDDYLAALRMLDPGAEVDDRPWEKAPGQPTTGAWT